MEWNDLSDLVPILISLFSLGISIYVLTRDKPKLALEKHSANFFKESAKCQFDFYLSNVGKEPTTIKSIEFYIKKPNFIPKASILEKFFKNKPGFSGLPPIEENVSISFPFEMMPHTSRHLEAELDFEDKTLIEKYVSKNNIHFHIKIKHTAGFVDKYI